MEVTAGPGFDQVGGNGGSAGFFGHGGAGGAAGPAPTVVTVVVAMFSVMAARAATVAMESAGITGATGTTGADGVTGATGATGATALTAPRLAATAATAVTALPLPAPATGALMVSSQLRAPLRAQLGPSSTYSLVGNDLHGDPGGDGIGGNPPGNGGRALVARRRCSNGLHRHWRLGGVGGTGVPGTSDNGGTAAVPGGYAELLAPPVALRGGSGGQGGRRRRRQQRW